MNVEIAKREIRALLVASLPHCLTIKELENTYREMMGKPFSSTKLGFPTILDFLKANPDVGRPIFRRGGELVVKAAEAPNSADAHIATMRVNQKPSRLTKMVPKTSLMQPKAPKMVSYYIQTKLKKFINLNKNGVQSTDEFQKLWRREFGEALNFRAEGFDSLLELLQSCPEIVRLKNTHQSGVNIVLPRTTSNDASSDSKPSKVRLPSGSSSKFQGQDIPPAEVVLAARNMIEDDNGNIATLKAEIKAILAQRPNGEWAARLPFSYQALYKKELDVSRSGHTSIIECIASMPDVARIERPVKNGDWLLWSLDTVSAAPTSPSKTLDHYAIPQNAATEDASYSPLEIPKEEHIEIVIVHVHNPGEFYFQINNTLDKLDTLMDEMRSFYTNVLSESYIFPCNLKKIGQVCAAVFAEDEHWYRAVILGIKPDNHVEVCYVDYGNTAVVKVSNLRLLKKSYLEVPKLVLKGCLANVRPSPMGGWSKTAIDIFHEKVKEKLMFCEIIEIQKNSLTIELIDTSGECDVYINQVLVEASVAKFKTCVARKPSKEAPLSQSPQAVPDTFTLQQQQQLWFLQQQQQQQQLLYQQLLYQQQQQQQAYGYVYPPSNQPIAGINGSFPQMPTNPTLAPFGMPMLLPSMASYQTSPKITEHSTLSNQPIDRKQTSERKLSHGSDEKPVPERKLSHTNNAKPVTERKSSHPTPGADEETAWKLDFMRKRSLSSKSIEEKNRDLSDDVVKDDVFEDEKPGITTVDVSNIDQAQLANESKFIEKSFSAKLSYYGERQDIESAKATDIQQTTSLVIKLKLKEPYQLHLLNYNGVPHVLGCEVSSLYWKEDILRSQLHQRKLKVANLIISQEENHELFDAMEKENISGIVVDSKIRSYVTLYRLESMKVVINTFKLRDESVYNRLDRIIKLWQSTPQTFWRDQSNVLSSDSDDSIQDSEALELEIEEIRLILKSLHFRKKRLVQGMMTGKSSSTAMDDLKKVDLEMESSKKKLAKKVKEWKID